MSMASDIVNVNDSSNGIPKMPTDGFRRSRPNPDRLPDHHVIYRLAEAKELYHSELPPFVEKNQGSNRAGSRKKVTLRVTDDQEQALPVEAEIICWSWNVYWTFYTIDIGGRRLIIKGNSADRYCSYRSWEGPVKGFSYQPVAFGPYQRDSENFRLDSRPKHASPMRTLSNAPFYRYSPKPDGGAQQSPMKAQFPLQSEWGRSNFSPINSPGSSSARSANSYPEHLGRQHHAQGRQHHSRTESTTQPASPSIEDASRPLHANGREFQIDTTPVNHDNQQYTQARNEREPSIEPRHGVLTSRRSEVSLNGPCDSDQISPPRRPSNPGPKAEDDNGLSSRPNEESTTESRRAHHTPAEATDERDMSTQPAGDSADIPTTHRSQHQDHDPTESNHLARPTKRKRQTSTSDPTKPTSRQPSTATRSPSTRSSPHQTPATFSQNQSTHSTPFTTSLTPTIPPTTSSSTSTLLPPHKQSQTTLFIAIPLSTDTVPLKLRSCMSLPSFFAAVLAVSALPHHDTTDADAAVSGIRATFGWKDPGDVDRCILLKRDWMDTWEVFLEIVDSAPCWGKGGRGRCGVGVEVVLV